MDNIYDDIDTRLNILYDYIYNTKSNNCYIFNGIVRKSITIEDLKMPDDFDGEQVLKEKMKFIGYYNNRWNFKRYSTTSFPSMISIGRYKDGKKTNSLNRGEIYDIGMMFIIGEIVSYEKFNHSLLPIMFFDIELCKLKKYNSDIYLQIKNNKSECNGKDKDMYYVLVSENYHTTMTLNSYIDENHNNFTKDTIIVLIFQVIYSLYKIYSKLNGFRHNKLDLNSILVVLRNNTKEEIIYNISDEKFKIPNVGIDIKISNYAHSNTKDYYQNSDTDKKMTILIMIFIIF